MKMINRIQNNIKRWFGQNLGAKVMAILVALFMWIYVMSVINPTINDSVNNIPVDLLNIEELERAGIVIKGEDNHTVNVRVTGRSDQVYRLSRQDFVATADLSGHRNIGANNVQVTVNVDADVEVEFNPRYIRVELEEVVRRQKNVDINILGDPATGYVLGEPRITPSAIWIEGPESNVNSVDAVIAELQLDEDNRDVVANLTLKPVDSRGNEVTGVRLESEVVEVILPVERTKTVIIEPNLDIEAQEGYAIRNTRVTPRSIMIQGPEGQLENLTRVETELIERTDLTASESIEVELLLPDGISLYNERTITVEIDVSEIVEEEYELSTDSIRFDNLGDGLYIIDEEIPEEIIITVRAPEEVIEKINRNSLVLVLDLEGLRQGEHSIEPIIEGLDDLGNGAVDITIVPAEFVIELVTETTDNEIIDDNGDINGNGALNGNDENNNTEDVEEVEEPEEIEEPEDPGDTEEDEENDTINQIEEDIENGGNAENDGNNQ